jgi:hypothetical protein
VYNGDNPAAKELERYRRREDTTTPEPIEVDREETWITERTLDEREPHGKQQRLRASISHKNSKGRRGERI